MTTVDPNYTIIVDTREQQPWSFKHHSVASKKLDAGDTTLDHDLPNVNGKMSTIKSAKSLSFVRFAITLFAF